MRIILSRNIEISQQALSKFSCRIQQWSEKVTDTLNCQVKLLFDWNSRWRFFTCAAMLATSLPAGGVYKVYWSNTRRMKTAASQREVCFRKEYPVTLRRIHKLPQLFRLWMEFLSIYLVFSWSESPFWVILISNHEHITYQLSVNTSVHFVMVFVPQVNYPSKWTTWWLAIYG